MTVINRGPPGVDGTENIDREIERERKEGLGRTLEALARGKGCLPEKSFRLKTSLMEEQLDNGHFLCSSVQCWSWKITLPQTH